jgi:hypothetical protein
MARRCTLAVGSLAVIGCGGQKATTGIGPENVTPRGFAGFDISIYPGDAALLAWRHPASPYRWVGYYLAAPCHRDASWMGTLPRVQSLGWGTALIYVGQQDWTNIPSARTVVAAPSQEAALVTCSASLLTAEQGRTEAADAIAKASSEGFPAGSTIYLDIENVSTVSPTLLDYYAAWIGAVLRDGQYRPGVYASKANAPALHQAAVDAYASAGASGAARFWIASSAGFTLINDPREVGLDYAAVWQGMFNVQQTWGGTTLAIDANVASSVSPSAPSAAAAGL